MTLMDDDMIIRAKIDINALHQALLDHFGTGVHTISILNFALGKVDALYENEDWQGLIDMARNEGLDLAAYITEYITDDEESTLEN